MIAQRKFKGKSQHSDFLATGRWRSIWIRLDVVTGSSLQLKDMEGSIFNTIDNIIYASHKKITPQRITNILKISRNPDTDLTNKRINILVGIDV